MKQFFRAIAYEDPSFSTRSKTCVFDPQIYSQSYKVMDHSYFGSPMVQAVLMQIENNPQNVAWVGNCPDKADSCDELKEDIWGTKRGRGVRKIKENAAEVEKWAKDTHQGYLINYDEQEYVDIGAYYEKTKLSYEELHPLPLLTASSK